MMQSHELKSMLAPAMETAAEQSALAGKSMDGQITDVLSAMIKVIVGQGKELIDTLEERKAVAEEVVHIFDSLFGSTLGPIAAAVLHRVLSSVVIAILERLANSA